MGHHYVPQEYLRGFAAPEQAGTIWMYDKQTDAFKRLPIKAVAQEADFYDQDTEAELNSARAEWIGYRLAMSTGPSRPSPPFDNAITGNNTGVPLRPRAFAS